ncbi:MAG: cytochrome c biogenesis protein [Alphaproteobacteria bacterium]
MTRFLLVIALLFCLLFQEARADEDYVPSLNYESWSNLPVLHEGRVKPLDSFARIHVRKWHGEDHYKELGAGEILAEMLFDPQNAAQRKFFYLRNNSVKAQLGLNKNAPDYFTLEELRPALESTKDRLVALLAKDSNDLTADQKEFLAIHENAAALSNIMRSFSLFLPLDVVLPDGYQERFDGQTLNYMNLSVIETRLNQDLQSIIRTKGDDIEGYSEEEQKIALLAFQLENLRSAGEASRIFKIIPASWGGQNAEEWYSPWELLLEGQGSPEASKYLTMWERAASAYRNGDARIWKSATAQMLSYMSEQSLYSPSLFTLEKAYNALKPYFWTRLLYTLAIALLLISFVKPHSAINVSVILATTAGIILHIGAIVSRILILDRPPVGTLYESVLFVALICVIMGLMLSLRGINKPALLSSLIAGLLLLFLAPVIAPEGESLEVLVAVLNTNFWLATHVTVITAGYGVCLIAACMAHYYLFLRLFRDKKEPGILKLYGATYRISILALLLTAVGTVLGGIWADQSWGRFWGWDPKENGALLIVLWLIWLQHGRISGNLKDVPFMAGMAYLNIIVGIAWFGVNLLGVGLHSYGFTSGLAYGLAIFCALETLIIAALWAGVRMRTRGLKDHAA